MIRVIRGLTIASTILLIAGCANDPLENAATEASRAGTIAVITQGSGGTAGVDAGNRVIERVYWVAKREASATQRTAVVERGRAAVRKLQKKSASAKVPKYLLIKAPADARSKTPTSVMLFETESQQIVGTNVYDVESEPTQRGIVKFETYTAEYVGAGL